jgi:spermidine/putrescine transport system permease protein
VSVAAERLPAVRGASLALRVRAAVRHHLLTVAALGALAFLLVPIVVVIAFSFNDPAGRFNFTWERFTFENWANPFGFPDLLGTLIALALARYRFRGRSATNLLIFLPMATPEIVLGSSLLALFLNYSVPLGFTTILLAHVMFNISFVVVTVRARLAGRDAHLEEAAMDLGAPPLTTFFRVTLPLIAPGILAAGLLAFALSVDDFVITYLVSGSDQTFPLFVWGAARVAVPPQINVIGTIIFATAVALMFANVLWQRRSAKGA